MYILFGVALTTYAAGEIYENNVPVPREKAKSIAVQAANYYHHRQAIASLTSDEYGNVISAMAPIEAHDGNYISAPVVDSLMDTYEEQLRNVQWILSLVFISPTIILSVIFIVMYFRGHKQLRSAVFTDSLTSIKNRRYINTFLSEIVNDHSRQTSPLSVIMVDVDNFKQFNDRYGHQEGDRVLVEITTAISLAVRKSDTVCRYGGEELFVILENSGPDEAELIARRIKIAVENLAIKHDASSVADIVTVSQGVYSAIPGVSDSGKDYIMHADKGLYAAKNTGRNRYVIVDATEQAPAAQTA